MTTPNILLVILDSLRAKNMSLYGHSRNTTPFLNSFSSDATIYTQARSPSIHSIASHASMFTGYHVEEHQAIHHTAQIDTSQTIWEEIQDNFDYTTGLFTNNRIIADASNLHSAFDYKHAPDYPIKRKLEDTIAFYPDAYFPSQSPNSQAVTHHIKQSINNQFPLKSFSNCTRRFMLNIIGEVDSKINPDRTRAHNIHGEEFTKPFLNWLPEQTEPWAACINLLETHSPYRPSAQNDKWSTDENWEIQEEKKPNKHELFSENSFDILEKLEPLYDGSIREADSIVEKLLTELENQGQYEDTLIIITSDHGEAFGETSRVDERVRLKGHSWGIHESLLHVPLIIKHPQQSEGREIDKVVSLTDLPKTIRSAANGNYEPSSLVTNEPVLASTYRLLPEDAEKYEQVGNIDKYVGPWRAVYEDTEDGVKKFAQKGKYNYTGLIPSAQEVNPVNDRNQQRVREIFTKLSNKNMIQQENVEIEEDLEEHLKDLGYIR